MNYRNLIKSREIRCKILSLLNWIPDELMLKIQYRIQTGRKLNLNNPQRFTEKIQLYKLRYRPSDLWRCVDKYEVRLWAEERGLIKYFPKCYGVFDKISDIDFEVLPPKFVIKTTDGGGGNEVYLCEQKNETSISEIIKKFTPLEGRIRHKQPGREYAYYDIPKTRFLIEELLFAEKGIVDYKFFCFNGQVKYLDILSDRRLGDSARLGKYDVNFNKLDVYEGAERPDGNTAIKPSNYEEMIKVAEDFSKYFPHVRVDMYNLDGRILLGELTFYDSSGYAIYNPDSFDYELGKCFNIKSF